MAAPAEPLVAEPPRPFRVTARRRETYDTWTLELLPVRGDALDPSPGQFTMIYAFGVGEVPSSVSAARSAIPGRSRQLPGRTSSWWPAGSASRRSVRCFTGRSPTVRPTGA